MKPHQSCFIIITVFLFACGQDEIKKKEDAENEVRGNTHTSNKISTAATAPTSAVSPTGLMGEWTCVLVSGDSNSNGKLDDEEKANGFSTYKDYLKLNPDGSCVYTIAHLDAKYGIVEKDGNRSIEVIAADGSRIKQGRIISLTEKELQLMKFSGGRDILVYHRP